MKPQIKTNAEILCIGNAIVDLFVDLKNTAGDVEPSFFEKYGIREPVQHIETDQAELILKELGITPDGEKPASDVIMGSGGGAANVSKIAAMLGMNTSFNGCAGKDMLAVSFNKELTEAGVNVVLSAVSEKTGICFIFKTNGETRIAASPRAALELNIADVDERQIMNAKVVVIDGFILDRRFLVQQILYQADRFKIPVALDAASVFQTRKRVEDILHYSRNYQMLIFMNADEAIVFYHSIRKGKEETGLSELEKEGIIRSFVIPMLKIITDGRDYPVFIIKLGSHGAMVVAGGNVYHEETSSALSGDTVGAGDAFCAAFLSAWVRGKPIPECAVLGNNVAGEILKVPGTVIKGDQLKKFAEELLE